MQAPEALELFFPLVAGEEDRDQPVRVMQTRAEIRSARREAPRGHLREYLLLPSTGGGFLLASLQNHGTFVSALGGLPISRPIWKLARGVLGALSRVGLRRHPGLRNLAVLVGDPSASAAEGYSIQAGVPGGGQKLVVREHGGALGESAFWKVGKVGLPAQLIQAEAAALGWLGEQGAAGTLGPRLLAAGDDADVSWIRIQALDGVRPSDELSGEIEAFLADLAGLARRRIPVAGSSWHELILSRLAAIGDSAPQTAGLCREALERVLKDSAGQDLEFYPAHGDFTPWNVLSQAGRLRAFDWEFFQPCAPAHFDRFHWVFQTGVLVQHLSASELQGRLDQVLSSCVSPGGDEGRTYLSMYLIDVLSREESIFRHGRPDFPQVQWLLETRTALLSGCNP